MDDGPWHRETGYNATSTVSFRGRNFTVLRVRHRSVPTAPVIAHNLAMTPRALFAMLELEPAYSATVIRAFPQSRSAPAVLCRIIRIPMRPPVFLRAPT